MISAILLTSYENINHFKNRHYTVKWKVPSFDPLWVDGDDSISNPENMQMKQMLYWAGLTAESENYKAVIRLLRLENPCC